MMILWAVRRLRSSEKLRERWHEGSGSKEKDEMKRRSLFILIIFLVIACTVSAQKASKPKYSIREGHPRLYITKERLGKIRERCADKRGAQAMYYATLKDFADKFTPDKEKPSFSQCFSLAFLYAMGEVPGYDYSHRSIGEYGKIGAELLTKLEPPEEDLSSYRRYTPMFIASYDWLFSAMTPEQREMVFKKFTSVADKMRAAMATSIGGRFRGTREMYGYYGLAFYGDGSYIYPKDGAAAASVNKKAKEYSDFFASWQRDENLAMIEAVCKGGAYPSGTMYGESPYPDQLWAYDAWDTASTDELYQTTTAITGYPLFWLYQMLPFRTHVRYDNANGRSDQLGGIVRFGDYRYIGYTPVAGPWLNIAQVQGVAARQGHLNIASVLNWLIQYKGDFKIKPLGGPFPVDRWVGAGPDLVWDIIFRDGLIEAKSPEEAGLPLAHLFGTTNAGPPIQPDFPHGRPEGSGIVVMRSSWEDQAGTLLWFKASSHFLIHGHRDQGSFQIYKKGWLAIDSGQYEETAHLGNYAQRTVAHNSLLVYRPGETLDMGKTDPVWNGFANDGGQRWVPPALTAADTKDMQHFIGGVTGFESVSGVYDYLHADLTRSYNSTHVTSEGHEPKVAVVTRTLLFLRPDEYIIVFDRVDSSKAGYPKRWLLHSVYRPEIDGSEKFDGVIPYTMKIPSKPGGVRLCGDKRGGISESRDAHTVTIKGWNFGPSDGRLVSRTVLPEKHITRIVGGGDARGIKRTVLAEAYNGGDTISVDNVDGFEIDDFVYVGETNKPYTDSTRGRPHWPVEDVLYQGWGKIQSVDSKKKSITMVRYRHSIPNLPAGTVVTRSNHGNANAYEFMDAEYNQWPMYGESVANAGPYHMQHGSWRVEVEPVEQKTADVFLHVMLPCDRQNLAESQAAVREKVRLIRNDDTISLEIKGKVRTYKIAFKANSPDAHVTVVEGDKKIVDNELSHSAIKARAK
jgi:hypothetical protein